MKFRWGEAHVVILLPLGRAGIEPLSLVDQVRMSLHPPHTIAENMAPAGVVHKQRTATSCEGVARAGRWG
jgi:hypothetical protein